MNVHAPEATVQTMSRLTTTVASAASAKTQRAPADQARRVADVRRSATLRVGLSCGMGGVILGIADAPLGYAGAHAQAHLRGTISGREEFPDPGALAGGSAGG